MPNVGVHVLVTNAENQVLLVRRNYLAKDWIPPGGRMEDNESVFETATRECLEETGLLIQPGELIVLGSRPKTNDLIVVIQGTIVKKQETKTDPEEISEIGFFSLDDLPSPMKPETIKILSLFAVGRRGGILIV